MAAECSPCLGPHPGLLCTLSLRAGVPKSLHPLTALPLPPKPGFPPGPCSPRAGTLGLSEELAEIGRSRWLVRDWGRAGDAATGPTVISGQCAAWFPAASPLKDKARDWAVAPPTPWGRGRGPHGWGSAQRPPCVPSEGSWAVWGPEHWGCDPIPGVASGQSSGSAAQAGSGAGWSLGWGCADRKAHGLLSEPRAQLSAVFRGRGPGQSCCWGQTLGKAPQGTGRAAFMCLHPATGVLGFQEHDSFYFGI